MTRCHRYMTLIELLIVIALLALIMGVVAFNIGSAVRTQRFQAGVALLIDRLRLAQDVMLILRSSVRVKLEQQDDGLHCTLVTEGGLTPALARAASETAVIQPLRAFSFTNDEGQSVSDSVTLDFMSAGSEMSRGLLTVASGPIDSAGVMQEQIYLPGFPTLIRTGPQTEDEKSPNREAMTELYPAEVSLEEKSRNEKKKEALPSS